MRGLSVKQRIAGSFLLIIAVILSTSVMYYLRALADDARVEHVETYDITGMAGAATVRALLNEHLHLTYQLVIEAQGSPKSAVTRGWLDRFKATDANLDRNFEQYEPIITDPRDRAATARFKEAFASYRRQHAKLLELLDHRDFAQANAFVNNELMPSWTQCRDELVTMMRVNQELVGEAMRGVRQAAGLNKVTALTALVLALAIAIVCGTLLYRSITGPLDATVAAMRDLSQGDLTGRLQLQRDDEFDAIEYGFNNMVGALRSLVAQAQRSALQLSGSISEIASTARQQQAAVTEAAATTAQIGVTSSEIASTSRELVRTMSEVSVKADQSAHFANSGQLGLMRIGEVTRQLTAAAGMVGDRLALLNERNGGIGQLVAQMAMVAVQIDRLSERVATEGERVGVQGRSFAALAGEARRLAERSTAGAAELERRMRDMQSALGEGTLGVARFSDEVQRGNTEMMQVGALLQQIIHQAQALAPRIQSVSEGMRAQSIGAEQINLALSQLTVSSGQTAQALTHANKAIQLVDEVAQGLRTGVSSFRA